MNNITKSIYYYMPTTVHDITRGHIIVAQVERRVLSLCGKVTLLKQ